MRRLIAYIALCATMIIGVGVSTSPVMLNMDTDLAYSSGKTLYFKASRYNEDSLVGNYDDFLDEEDKDGQTYIVDDIADTMSSRLDAWGISDYEIKTEGYNTIAVSLRSSKNKTIEYTRLESYLSFSGQDYELDASNTTAEGTTDEQGNAQAGYVGNDKWKTMLDGKTASFTLLDKDDYQVPVVTVPIDSSDKSAFLELLTYCEEHTVEEVKDDDGNITVPEEICNVVLWANRIEGVDKYEEKSDPNVAAHILFEHSPADDSCVYYADDDDDKEYPYFQMIPESKATESGTYNPNYAQEATDAANYLVAMFNASAYTYDSDSGANSQYRVNFIYDEDLNATADSLIKLGDWTSSPAFSKTMVSVVVAMVLIAALLAVSHRILALEQFSVALLTGFAAFGTFVAFGAQFNIAAFLCLAVVVLVSLFQSLFYASRLKNEIYKGRTLKKAQAEASKASTWPVIDAGLVTLIVGIFLYVLGGNVLRAGGIMLTLGGFYSIFTALILNRFSCWLLCNDSSMQKIYPKALGIDASRIPNLMKEEKQTYFGRFQDKKVGQGKKVVLAVSSLLILAGIGTMIGFGVANSGDIYNDASYKENSTVLRLEVKSETQDAISISSFADTSQIYDADSTDHSDYFHQYTINGTVLADYVSTFNTIETPKTVYESPDAGEDGMYYYYFYYEAVLNKLIDGQANAEIKEWNGTEFVDSSYSTPQDLADAIAEIGGTDKDDSYNVSAAFETVVPTDLVPWIGNVCLGLGVGLAVAMVYLVLRYRPSRGLAITFTALGATYISLSFFVFTRIVVSPVVALGMPAVSLFGLLSALFILAREKEVMKEDHEEDRVGFMKRSEHLNKATAYEAENVLLFTGLSLIAMLSGLLFGPAAYYSPYLLASIGVLIAVILVLVLNTPFSILLGKGFSKIHFHAPKRKKKELPGQITKRKKGGEPEEAIFIGIND